MSPRVFFRLNIARANVGHATFTTSSPRRGKDVRHDKVNSWQIHSYGGLEELQLTKARPPIVRDPNDVVVKVLAASVNPLDIAMMNGYGSVLLNFLRQAKSFSLQKQLEFPLTLGRDFAGVVVQKGHSVGPEYDVGEEVWGIVPPHDQGSHAEQVMVCKNLIKKKPANISMVEAGSMLYAAVTAWSALKITGDVALFGAKGKTVLVIGGSGGVGTMAVQMLKNWGARVVTTCNTDAVPLLRSLGITDVVDYKADNSLDEIKKHRYDIILDCAGLGEKVGVKYCQYLKDYQLSKFITLKSPMLRNVDDFGLVGGMLKNFGDLVYTNVSSGCLPKSASIRWGFFLPIEQALTEITEDVNKAKILPCVHKTYSFSDLPRAYERAQAGHLRGKIVIDMTKRGETSVS